MKLTDCKTCLCKMTERDIKYPNDHDGAFFVKCPSCGRQSGYTPTVEQAVALWNGTPEPSPADLTAIQAIKCALYLDEHDEEGSALDFLQQWKKSDWEYITTAYPQYKEFLK